jgi:hypothetical protein
MEGVPSQLKDYATVHHRGQAGLDTQGWNAASLRFGSQEQADIVHIEWIQTAENARCTEKPRCRNPSAYRYYSWDRDHDCVD